MTTWSVTLDQYCSDQKCLLPILFIFTVFSIHDIGKNYSIYILHNVHVFLNTCKTGQLHVVEMEVEPTYIITGHVFCARSMTHAVLGQILNTVF